MSEEAKPALDIPVPACCTCLGGIQSARVQLFRAPIACRGKATHSRLFFVAISVAEGASLRRHPVFSSEYVGRIAAVELSLMIDSKQTPRRAPVLYALYVLLGGHLHRQLSMEVAS